MASSSQEPAINYSSRKPSHQSLPPPAPHPHSLPGDISSWQRCWGPRAMRELRVRATERRERRERRVLRLPLASMPAEGRKGSGAPARWQAADGRGRREGWHEGLVVLMALATGAVLLVREGETERKGVR